MNHFSINGIERESPLQQDSSFHDLIRHVQEKLLSPEALIASIRVDGVEVSESEEQRLYQISLGELESVEITLAHPREMAEDTLQTLVIFAEKLIELSRQAADSLDADPVDRVPYDRLLDGIQTFAETITAVKAILRIGLLQPVNVLEVDLISTMKDLLGASEKGDVAYRALILRDHLPGNLQDWISQGIPSIIRSRDS